MDPVHASSPGSSPDSAVSFVPQSDWGKGFLAACGSALVPGLGQWLAGYSRRGALWFLAALASVVLFWVMIPRPELALVAVAVNWVRVAIHVGAALDAFVVARRSERRMLGVPARRYLAGIGLLVIGAGVALGLRVLTPLALRAAGVREIAITTQAMLPTLKPGDRILAHRGASLRRWDLAIFHPPGRLDIWTRRIAGLPGEKVEIVSGQLRINDAPVPTPPGIGPYASRLDSGPQTGCEGHPIVLGPAEYFVLCDNPAAPFDSRNFPDPAPGHPIGAVPEASILGRVTAVRWPPQRLHRFQ